MEPERYTYNRFERLSWKTDEAAILDASISFIPLLTNACQVHIIILSHFGWHFYTVNNAVYNVRTSALTADPVT